MRCVPLRITVVTLIFMLSACFGGGHYAPVVERQGRPSVVPDSHRVHRGETLYSIAWRYRIDFRQLAAANDIGPPYTIYPGQRLRIRGVQDTSADRDRSTPGAASTPAPQEETPSSAPRPKAAPETSVADNDGIDRKRYPFSWQWPAKGSVTTSFSSASAVHKGIDIRGKLGEPVIAANSGKVVYAGSGLVGYGKLLIIKHDEHYLSAYGHNRKLLVKEGELVRGGQKVAEFGDTGTDTVKLHFEVRRDGKPINPLKVLPRR